MGYDTGIADRLRAAGLHVVEIAGWRTRGSSSFNPFGSLDHHTAGSRNGNAPSLNICIYGRSDLPGPLCQVLMGRDNTCYVIAAGRANHAGKGQWGNANGNEDLYGIERENVGTSAELWRPDQTDAAAKAHAALIRGRAGADMVCRHAEYALPPGRKPDTHSISGNALRGMVAVYLADPHPEPEPEPVTQESDIMPYPTIAVSDEAAATPATHRYWAVLKPGQTMYAVDWDINDANGNRIPLYNEAEATTSREVRIDSPGFWAGLYAGLWTPPKKQEATLAGKLTPQESADLWDQMVWLNTWTAGSAFIKS